MFYLYPFLKQGLIHTILASLLPIALAFASAHSIALSKVQVNL
jgi:cell division protein FtsX